MRRRAILSTGTKIKQSVRKKNNEKKKQPLIEYNVDMVRRKYTHKCALLLNGCRQKIRQNYNITKL